MATTIRDVANRAGVSIATVSRVLNRSAPVNSDKRARVEAAARALGYAPNPAARSLLNKRTGSLGLLVPFAGGEFFSELLSGADQAAQAHGYHLLISTSHRDLETLRVLLRDMEKRVDGLMVITPEVGTEDLAYLAQRDTPAVCVNTVDTDERLDTFTFENRDGVRRLTTYLLEQGHRRIALIRGPALAHDAIDRASGYRAALATAGVPHDPALEIPGDYSQEAGYAAVPILLAMDPPPTAIIAANDYCAMGVLGALHEQGVRVPEDLSVAGFDDVPSARYTAPALTSVRVPIRRIGMEAVEHLVSRLKEDTPFQRCHRQYPAELVIRQSTGPAPA